MNFLLGSGLSAKFKERPTDNFTTSPRYLFMQKKIPARHQRRNGFSLVELLVAVAVIAILGAIAIPTYRNYVAVSKLKSAESVLEQFPVLLESFRAENGQFPANGTYNHTENDNGTPALNEIVPILTDFRAKKSTSSEAILYDYKLVITNTGTVTESATYTATPAAGRGAPAGVITGTYQ